jgi:hypothetical protein
MNKKIILSVSLPVYLVLSACASTPDPAEVCSAEWIQPRAERAMTDFKKDTRSTFKKLKKAGDTLTDGGTLGPLQMYSLMGSINRLTDNFENGRAMKDMRTLASTCNDPDLIKTAMTDFMREQGISERFINFLNNLKEYQNLLATGKRPELKASTVQF